MLRRVSPDGALKILKRDTTIKENIRGKHLRAGWDERVVNAIYAAFSAARTCDCPTYLPTCCAALRPRAGCPSDEVLLCFLGNVSFSKNLKGSAVVMAKEESKSKKKGKGQADRLSVQHLKGGGVVGIFGEVAQIHDADIRSVVAQLFELLKSQFPHLEFRVRNSIRKEEIHKKLNSIDSRLGVKLFIPTASIQPDGRVMEVLDKNGLWRVILVGESKHQGNDVQNIADGVRTPMMEAKGQYIMPAGNAIERVHKNIQELKNFMLGESHFPYVVFLQGSNFATEALTATWPDGTIIPILPSDSSVNRIDRVTACNYGMEINQNYCRNIVIEEHPFGRMMLQVASIYAQCDLFDFRQMSEVLWDTAKTSLEVLADELPAGAISE